MANAATWERRVAQWRESGLTSEEFSQGRGFSPKTLVWWSSRLKALGMAKRDEFPMARVKRASEPTAGGRSGVTIESGGLHIGLEVGFDQATLAAVLAVLGRQA